MQNEDRCFDPSSSFKPELRSMIPKIFRSQPQRRFREPTRDRRNVLESSRPRSMPFRIVQPSELPDLTLYSGDFGEERGKTCRAGRQTLPLGYPPNRLIYFYNKLSIHHAPAAAMYKLSLTCFHPCVPDSKRGCIQHPRPRSIQPARLVHCQFSRFVRTRAFNTGLTFFSSSDKYSSGPTGREFDAESETKSTMSRAN